MRYRVGDRVRVRVDNPPHHYRTPMYVQGHVGVVAAVQGEFPNPEQLAYGRDGLPRVPLYMVRFFQSEVWPGYAGGAADSVTVDLYEHWLNPG